MTEERDKTSLGLLVGGVGGAALGATITALLISKPVEAAPPEEKLNYLIECLTVLVPVLAEVAEGNAQLITLFQQWLAVQGVEPGVEVTVKTPWVAKIPEHIYSYAIRTIGTFHSDSMVDWTKGKRLLIMVQSTLNQIATIQLIGNFVDDMNQAVDVDAAIDCLADDNISIGPAWDDWHPFIGVRITTAIAPTAGILNIWAVIQE